MMLLLIQPVINTAFAEHLVISCDLSSISHCFEYKTLRRRNHPTLTLRPRWRETVADFIVKVI